jgi:tetratricopeptide (TPR) repeat protein
MGTKRLGGWLITGRGRVLLGVLAVALVVLFFRWDDLTLAYRISAAQRAMSARDFSGAIAALEKSKSRGTSSSQWQYLAARAHRRAGQLAKAESHLALAESLGWNPADIERQRLLAKAQSGRIKELESKLVELLAHGADDQAAEEIYEAMARGYLTAFLAEDAARCLKFWKEFQPDNPLAHLWTAELFVRTEKREAAVAALKEVLRLQPDNREAALKLARFQLDLSNLDEAAPLFEQCLEAPDSAGDALLGLAECRRSQGSMQQAKSHLYDALILDLPAEKAASALTTLGQMSLEERQTDRAIAMLTESVDLNPRQAQSRLALAAALIAINRPDLAEKQRAAARQITEQNARLLSLTRRVVTEPQNADLRSDVGALLIEMGLPLAGADWLKTAVVIDPGHPAANRALADFYRRVGDQQQAAKHAAAARQAGPATDSDQSHNG